MLVSDYASSYLQQLTTFPAYPVDEAVPGSAFVGFEVASQLERVGGRFQRGPDTVTKAKNLFSGYFREGHDAARRLVETATHIHSAKLAAMASALFERFDYALTAIQKDKPDFAELAVEVAGIATVIGALRAAAADVSHLDSDAEINDFTERVLARMG